MGYRSSSLHKGVLELPLLLKREALSAAATATAWYDLTVLFKSSPDLRAGLE